LSYIAQFNSTQIGGFSNLPFCFLQKNRGCCILNLTVHFATAPFLVSRSLARNGLKPTTKKAELRKFRSCH